MSTKYTYSIQNDFPNNLVNTSRLNNEIVASTITRALDYINTSADDCDIWFLDTLTAGDVTTLSGVVAAHDGTALPTTAMPVSLSEEYRDKSGRLRIQETSRPLNTHTYFTGAGDDPTDVTDVGGGEFLNVCHTISGATTQSVTIDLNMIENETYIHEGYITWKNACCDSVSFEVIPRTVNYTVSSGTYYNIYGGYLVVPAAGDGTANITSDITQPDGGLVYMADNDVGVTPTAYWNADWNTTTKEFENIAAAPLGDGRYNMFTVAVVLSRFANRLPLIGDGFIMLQSADAEQIGHGMRFRLTAITSATEPDHDWKLGGILTFHRKNSV